jgi:hypothetical protein
MRPWAQFPVPKKGGERQREREREQGRRGEGKKEGRKGKKERNCGLHIQSQHGENTSYFVLRTKLAS